MGEQTLTIIGFPNRFQIFRANNPSDVFTQKCLCTTQEYFLPLDKKSSEIEELEIRRKNACCLLGRYICTQDCVLERVPREIFCRSVPALVSDSLTSGPGEHPC